MLCKAMYNGKLHCRMTFRGIVGHYFMTWISHFLLLVSLLRIGVVYTLFFCKLLLNHAACILSAGMKIEFICGDP